MDRQADTQRNKYRSRQTDKVSKLETARRGDSHRQTPGDKQREAYQASMLTRLTDRQIDKLIDS